MLCTSAYQTTYHASIKLDAFTCLLAIRYAKHNQLRSKFAPGLAIGCTGVSHRLYWDLMLELGSGQATIYASIDDSIPKLV